MAKEKKGHTVRFAALVKEYGSPEVLTIWSDPKKDRAFMQLVKANKIITLTQPPGGKSAAEVGFKLQRFATYARFPKGMKEDVGTKIVGVKYDLFQITGDNTGVGEIRKNLKKKQAKIPPPKKRNISYKVTIERTFSKEFTVTVRAEDEEEARKLAIEKAGKRSEGKAFRVVADDIVSLKKT